MPRLPIITAERNPAIYNVQNKAFPYNTGEGLSTAGTALESLGSDVGTVLARVDKQNTLIQQKIQKQQDDTAIIDLTSTYNAKLKVARQDLPMTQLDPLKWQDEFTTIEANVASEIGSLAINDTVKRGFLNNRLHQFPAQSAEVRADGRALAIKNEEANLDRVGVQLSNDAAVESVEQAKANGITYNDYLARAKENGLLTDLGEERLQKKFTDNYLSKNMEHLANSNQAQFWQNLVDGKYTEVPATKQDSILNTLNTKIKMEESAQDKATRKVAFEAEQAYAALAAFNNLPQSLIDRGKAGKDLNLPDVHAWVRLEHLNNNQATSVGTVAVKVLQQEYDSIEGLPHEEHIRKFQRQLNSLMLDIGAPNEAARHFAEKMQSDLRSENTQNLREIEVGVARFKLGYKEIVSPHIPPSFLGMDVEKNQRAADEAAAIKRLKEKTSTVDEELKRTQEKYNIKARTQTPAEKATNDILKNRKR